MASRRRTLVVVSAVLVVLVVVAVAIFQLSNSRTFQLFGALVHRVETPEKVVSLTLDDGPSVLTPQVLQTLEDADVPATFYVTGSELEQRPELGRAIVEAGHELGNHTATHRRMMLVGSGTVAEEIERTDAAIRETGFDGEITFRPPYGKKLVALPRYLDQHDRTTVMWDVEPDSDASDTETIVQTALDETRPGSIILLHVMYPSRTASLEAIPGIVDGLRAEGYRFVTVSELLDMQTS
ncbi:polysaccharide deacetylase [Rhodococcus sp. p52]|uniref:Polysaccharide deacetylase family protein n=1 Tax=Rhodococcus pyridinivorans TaxID=103816 RepID=A0A495NIX2_9NOCA|nr:MULTISPECIES: polysaccharide deacetylase family protein [Rhodococcus]AOD20596.1 polysaccharide deacetylase [Rhodococcus sp. p52]KHJ72403.1 polysaccharide deacetylase [Rhodococcus sp. Chr-9]QOV98023.1 polysaccharide deacetylase family protein [Rhodococcus pyridinivorans]WMM71891.1 polysaccharide deacetylase family protein [Rhodococcus pyridinivorans]